MSTKAQQEVQRIMASLTSAIVEHRLPPGARLTEAKLVEVLSANRNHVRAALQKLASETKVVSLIPNRGAFVAKPTAEEAREIFSARMVLERAIVELAVTNLTPRNHNRLLKQVDKEREAIARQDRQQMIRESGNFHRLLADISGNRVLGELLEGLITRTSLIIALYQETFDVKCSIGEHQAVAEAILRQDRDEAIRLMDHHMDDIQNHLLLDESEPEVDLRAALLQI
ncbi:GntR family transcriptional regulator [Marinobacter nanhaiticus D15-8W]|nr:GntR family transcriptional regulator [Marinobacter nanhaiticus]BES70335.1 GntR family transcriptional regulator [Marinobacter nanhaiticus D15-8W]